MANHIINKQIINLALDSDEQAHQIQEKAKGLYYDKVLPKLDELFARLSPNGKVYRFNRLEVDLGQVRPENLEEAFVARLPMLLEEIILEKTNNLKFPATGTDELKTGSEEGSLFEAFIHYLKTGLLPWWFSDKDVDLPENLFMEVAGQLQGDHLKTLESTLKIPLAKARMVRQFSVPFIDKLLKQFPGPRSYLDAEIDKQKETKQFSTILSILINEALYALKEMSIDEDIQGKVRLTILEALLGETSARKMFPLASIGYKLTPETQVLVEGSVQAMVNVLLGEGYKQKDIVHLFTGAANILPENTLTGLWIEQYLKDDQVADKVLAGVDKVLLKETKEEKVFDEDTGVGNLLEEGIYINNAGLILLWPFLKPYFSSLGLLQNENFKTQEAKERAVLLLHYVVTGKQTCPEQGSVLNKVLCGQPVHFPVFNQLKVTENEKGETNKLINTAIEQWGAIGKVSVTGFRGSFLQREGKLQLTDSGWNLKVDRKSYDLLLDRLPWMISMIKLKWMDKVLYVDW